MKILFPSLFAQKQKGMKVFDRHSFSTLLAIATVALVGCQEEDFRFETLPNGKPKIVQVTRELQELYITTIKSARDGTTWLGTGQNGLVKFDGAPKYFNYLNGKFPNAFVNDMAFDMKGNIWVGTNIGLIRFDGENEWEVYNSSNSPIAPNGVSNLVVDQNNVLWLSCKEITEGGLMSFDGENWGQFTAEIPGNDSYWITDLKVDYENQLWIGINGYRGVVKLENGAFTYFDRYEAFSPTGLDFDKEGNLLVTITGHFMSDLVRTERLLLKFDRRGAWESVSPDYKSLGMDIPENFRVAAVDHNNLIWAITNNTKQDRNSFRFEFVPSLVYVGNGQDWALPLVELGYELIKAIHIGPDNQVLLGSLNGLIIIYQE